VQIFVERSEQNVVHSVDGTPPLAAIWDAVNQVRTIGPAPVIDALSSVRIMEPSADLLGSPVGDLKTPYLDAFDLFFLPILDGILRHEADGIASAVIAALVLEPEGIQATGRLRLVPVSEVIHGAFRSSAPYKYLGRNVSMHPVQSRG
jgi:5-methylcytosine-specific restriction protein B